MAKPTSTRLQLVLGYDLRSFEDSLGLRLSYGAPTAELGRQDRRTPMLVMMPTEARDLAKSLMALADAIENGTSPEGAYMMLH